MNDEGLSEEQFAVLVKLADTLGDRAAAQQLGIGVDSLLRVLARRPSARRGTIALIQRSLEQCSKKEEV
jgi:hypothetical protein